MVRVICGLESSALKQATRFGLPYSFVRVSARFFIVIGFPVPMFMVW